MRPCSTVVPNSGLCLSMIPRKPYRTSSVLKRETAMVHGLADALYVTRNAPQEEWSAVSSNGKAIT
jgi:hypothetical protein